MLDPEACEDAAKGERIRASSKQNGSPIAEAEQLSIIAEFVEAERPAKVLKLEAFR